MNASHNSRDSDALAPNTTKGAEFVAWDNRLIHLAASLSLPSGISGIPIRGVALHYRDRRSDRAFPLRTIAMLVHQIALGESASTGRAVDGETTRRVRERLDSTHRLQKRILKQLLHRSREASLHSIGDDA
jgi:hypothetical protein